MIEKIISEFIFETLTKLGGTYSKKGNGIITFKVADENMIREYLGTYFLRSLLVSNIVFNNLLSNTNYFNFLKEKEEINVLDIGCGAAPEIFGLIFSLCNRNLKLKINVDLFDANILMKKYYQEFKNILENKMNINLNDNYFIYDFAFSGKFSGSLNEFSLTRINKTYDIILNFNMINELYRTGNEEENYKIFVEQMVKFLKNDGLLFLTDVCDKDNYNRFFPIIFNDEMRKFFRENCNYTTILPVPCYVNYDGCLKNNRKCFTQLEIVIKRRNSLKGNCYKYDSFKTNYKVITKKEFAKKLVNRNSVSYNSKYISVISSYSFNICNKGRLIKFIYSDRGLKNGFLWEENNV